MTDITLLSKPGCVQCTAVARRLIANGVEFEKIDVTQDPEWLAKLEERGIQRVPVTVKGDTWIEGFDPDGLETLF
jgi:glutaredoxin-like protein NrdH